MMLPHIFSLTSTRKCGHGPVSLSAFLLFICSSLFFVACPRLERPYPPPTPEEIVQALKARGKQISSVRGEMKMNHRTDQGKIKATVRFMAERGDRVRYDVVTPFDTSLATLVANGKDFVFIDGQKNRYYYGLATPCNIARLIQVSIRPDDVLTLLAGSTPLIPFHRAGVSWDEQAGAEELTLWGNDLKQIIHLDGTNHSWDVLMSRVENSKGELLLNIQADDHYNVSSMRIPKQLQVKQPKQKAELSITLKKIEINQRLPSEAFDLPSPSGLATERLECGSSTNSEDSIKENELPPNLLK